MKFFSSIQWPQVTLIGVLALCFTALVIKGLIPKETFLALVTGVTGWMLPSPVQKKEEQ